MTSPFLRYDEFAHENELAILHLKRDILTPTLLHSQDVEDQGYEEGEVINTRFGSFPHSTLIGTPWGLQVRASAVDTGSRGRKDLKRKRDGSIEPTWKEETKTTKAKGQKSAVEARTGFVHLLPPTPERWTTSLPHRTQVVYTPDYSYILHRLKARPGTRLIEAGAGSGSFTHAAARAVFNGYPPSPSDPTSGKVFSFEFHAPRAEKLAHELSTHGLDGTVELTPLDVCTDGFSPSTTPTTSVKATAIFLDLPSPWPALKHLTRSPSSALDPDAAVQLSVFSPCIEQVQRTINTLRQLGWLEIAMVELAAQRIEVRRERVGIAEEGQRGVNDSPATVDEALIRLREQESKQGAYHAGTSVSASSRASPMTAAANGVIQQEERKLYKEGKLVTRTEPELRTHTSYLVFAVLPREWSEEDEAKAREKWADHVEIQEVGGKGMSRRGEKRRERERKEKEEKENDQDGLATKKLPQ